MPPPPNTPSTPVRPPTPAFAREYPFRPPTPVPAEPVRRPSISFRRSQSPRPPTRRAQPRPSPSSSAGTSRASSRTSTPAPPDRDRDCRRHSAPRSPPSIRPFDYQELEYVDEVDETLICPICRTPFYEPITTKRCGHTFCTACLRRAIELQPSCPFDRQPITFHPDQLCNPRIVSHQLDRLNVRCPNAGCDYVTSRGLLTAHHERQCEFTPVPCPDPGCDKLVPRGDAGSELGCLHREMRCRYCDALVLLADREKHYDTQCEGHTAKCEQCCALVVRHRMVDHMLSHCPEGEARCKWSDFGCPLRAKRRTVEAHEEAGCVYEAVMRLIQDRAEDRVLIGELRDRIAAVEGRMRRTEGLASPSGGWSARGADLDLDDGPTLPYGRGNPGGNGNGAWGSPEDYMLAQFERIETKIEDLRKSVTEQDGRHSMMLLNETMLLKEQIAELRSNMGVIGMHTTWLMNVQRQNRGGAGAGGTAGQGQQQQRASASGGGSAGSGAGRAVDEDERRDLSGHRVQVAPRRMSGENPPRL